MSVERFQIAFTTDASGDSTDFSARFSGRILTVIVKKSPEVQPRKIEINVVKPAAE